MASARRTIGKSPAPFFRETVMAKRFRVCLVGIVLSFIVFGSVQGETVELVVLHVNDTHGHWSPAGEGGKNVGGVSRLASAVREIRAANPGRVLLLHAGDEFSRAELPVIYSGGEASMILMEAMSFDGYTPGNGDFYYGIKNLKHITRDVRFNVLMANLVYRQGRQRALTPFVIKELNGVKVAVMGLGLVRMNRPSTWPLELRDPVATAKALVPELRTKADVVIALTHIGLGDDRRLAREVPGLDLVIGGHSHDRVAPPEKIQRPNGQGCTYLAMAGEYYRYLGRLDLRLERTAGRCRLVDVQGRLLPLDEKIKPDPQVEQLLVELRKPQVEVVCQSKVQLTVSGSKGVASAEDLVLLAMRQIAEADVAVLDKGGAAAGVEIGPVTVGDVYRIHPYRNLMLEFSLTGEQLKAVLKQDKDKPLIAGCRLVKVNGNDTVEVNGRLAMDNRKYKVVVGEFCLQSLPMLHSSPFKELPERVDTALLKYLKRVKVLEVPLPSLGLQEKTWLPEDVQPCHPEQEKKNFTSGWSRFWIPAFAGMTKRSLHRLYTTGRVPIFEGEGGPGVIVEEFFRDGFGFVEVAELGRDALGEYVGDVFPGQFQVGGAAEEH